MFSISLDIYNKIRDYGYFIGIRKNEGNLVKLSNYELYTYDINPPFELNSRLELLFRKAGVVFYEEEPEIQGLLDFILKPTWMYATSVHYYHDALTKFCFNFMRTRLSYRLIRAQNYFKLHTGQMPTIQNINRFMINSTKNGNEVLSFNLLSSLIKELYVNNIKSELLTLVLLKNYGLKLTELNIKVSACRVLKSERALERYGYIFNEEVSVGCFKEIDRLIYYLSSPKYIHTFAILPQM